jgi:hypothetical protein
MTSVVSRHRSKGRNRRKAMAKKRLKIYKELRESLQDALACERGEPANLRVTEIPTPPKKITPRKTGRSATH